jgi:hypothetical protein
MTDDLVSDLRLNAEHQILVIEDYRRAANRIEKLEAALRSIAANACCDSCLEAALVARKALEGKDG